MVLHLLREPDSASLKLSHRSSDVIAVEGDVGRSRRWLVLFGRMDSQVGFGDVEDKPTPAHVGATESELVFEEGPELVGVRGIEHGVKTANHNWFLLCQKVSCIASSLLRSFSKIPVGKPLLRWVSID